jgi:hypothetical protein
MVKAKAKTSFQSRRHQREGREQLDEIIAISHITMKRLLNYHRVVEIKAKAANKRQWMEMTLENMRKAAKSRQRADLIGATVAYAGHLFRVQKKTVAYRASDCDGLLYNTLIELMNRLGITVETVAVDVAAFRKP